MFRVYRSLEDVGPEARECCLSIGNFDGVHAAHRKLLRRNHELARQHGWRPSVLTFDPHPTTVIAPHRAPKLLTTLEHRLSLMEKSGIEQVFVLPFDKRFSKLSPEEFVQKILVDTLGARAVLVGSNFRFGHRQSGNVQTLRELGDRLGFLTEVVPGVTLRGRLVSSTEIRKQIRAGNVSLVCRLLERPYSLEGSIVAGHGVGAKQTVPTLNLRTDAEVLPARGVYVTRTTDVRDGRCWPSITNVGTRPTFDGDSLTIETYLLAPLEGSKPDRIELQFLRRVRDERRFDSPELLKAQILRDVGRAKAFFRRLTRLRTGT